MANTILNIGIVLNNAANTSGDNWDIDFNCSDYEGLYYGTDVMVGDVLLIDTSPYMLATITRYKITNISTANSVNVVCSILLDDDNPGVDLSFCTGLAGFLCRPTQNKFFNIIPALGVQGLPDKFDTYVRNSDFSQRLDLLKGSIETFQTVALAENRLNNIESDLIYVVENETIYAYYADALSGIPSDGYYVLKDNSLASGRWKGIAGKYVFDSKNSGTHVYSHTIVSPEIGVWNTYKTEQPSIEAYFWDNSEGKFDLLSDASLMINVNSSGVVDYDTTYFVFDTDDKIILYAYYTNLTTIYADEFDSGWLSVGNINNTPSLGDHRIELPTGFSDNPAGYSLTLDNGIKIFPADISPRLSFSNNGSGIYQVTINTSGLITTDKFRLVCSKSARPTGAYTRGISHDAVVGTTEQVTYGYATHTSLQSALNFLSSGGRILILSPITENITWSTSNISVEGKGRTTLITGNISILGNGNSIRLVRCLGNVTISGDINYFSESWLAPTYTLTNSGVGNYSSIIEEV